MSERMSDAAVQAQTGKTWPEWFTILDAAGAQNMTHQEIVAVLHEQHGVGPWWRQMVTVEYERERGLRERHEKPDGYEISVSKTIAVPVADLYEAWIDASIRKRWLPDAEFTVRKATPCKSVRITWPDGNKKVEVMFYPKGKAKCQVTVQHGKLPDADAGVKMKAYWAE